MGFFDDHRYVTGGNLRYDTKTVFRPRPCRARAAAVVAEGRCAGHRAVVAAAGTTLRYPSEETK